MELKKVKIADIIPYKNNPRKNDDAVDAVAESIRQCGYCSPIVVDENMVVLAGHTRLKALKKLGRTEAEVVIRDGLTDEQKKKYRLLDNKTNEFAEWDFGRLNIELMGVDFDGYDFGFAFVESAEMPDELDAEVEKLNVVATINFPSFEEYDAVKDELQEIVDRQGATLAVKMA